VPFVVIVLVALSFGLISVDPPIVLFLLLLVYALSGYVYWLNRRLSRKRADALPSAK
jgi:CDP-diacylglycerol--serine O-phosphatidyltransferase